MFKSLCVDLYAVSTMGHGWNLKPTRTIKCGIYEFCFWWKSNDRTWEIEICKAPFTYLTNTTPLGIFTRGQGEAIMSLLDLVNSKFATHMDTQFRTQSKGAS